MKKKSENNQKVLNNLDSHINRGFELVLRHHHREDKLSKPKSFSVHFGKMLSLFSREINFEFSFNIIKK
jgi:hypothetical protein